MAHKNEKTKKPEMKQSQYAKLREDPPFALIEAFRNLSTNIGFATPKHDGKGRVICISSSIPNEGKTTISVNLAISCAGAGEKTVLIDCDMRKPAIRRYFNADGKKGIAEYLSGQAELSDILITNAANNLDIICGNKAVPNPLLLIKSERFDSLVNELAKKYDYVILDTPPLEIVSDALEVSKNTDGILVVTRQKVSEIPMIRNTISDISFANVNLLGFILNDYNAGKSGKGYYGKYNYRYSGYQNGFKNA